MGEEFPITALWDPSNYSFHFLTHLGRDGVYFIDEENTRRALSRLFKQLSTKSGSPEGSKHASHHLLNTIAIVHFYDGVL